MNRNVAEIPLPCECGQHILVTEGMAGASVRCPCGRTIAVPSLGEIRRLAGRDLDIAHTAATDPTADNALLQPSSAVLYGAMVAWTCFVAGPVLVLLLLSANWLTAFGFAVVVVGHVWLFTQIYVGNPVAALVVLLIPIIGPTLAEKFIVDHWNIACWPVICQALGVALLVGGIAIGTR